MNSCDFGLGNYTYIEDKDSELKTFSVEHDEAEILPLLRDALPNGHIPRLLSPSD